MQLAILACCFIRGNGYTEELCSFTLWSVAWKPQAELPCKYIVQFDWGVNCWFFYENNL